MTHLAIWVFYPAQDQKEEESVKCKGIEDFSVDEIVTFIKGYIEKFTSVVEDTLVKAPTNSFFWTQ